MKTRQSKRAPLSAEGSCRTSRGEEWDVVLEDLSEGGCRIEDGQGRLTMGEVVRLYMAGTGPHSAKVAWRGDDRAGLEFSHPLAERVLDQISAHEGQAQSPGKRSGGKFGEPRRIV